MPQKQNKSAAISILSFNLLGLPLLSKNYSSRMKKIAEEIIRLNPDVLCFQEAWLSITRRFFRQKLDPYGFHYFFHPASKFKFNGLFILSKYKIIKTEAFDFKPSVESWRHFGLELLEMIGSRGYSMVEIKPKKSKSIFIFNLHLAVGWSVRIKPEQKWRLIQLEVIKKIAARINKLKNKKIIVAGDFNLERGSFLYQQSLVLPGLTDPFKNIDLKTILINIFRFPLAGLKKTGRWRDFIFLKNFPADSVRDCQLVWDQPFKKVGYLSDHAGVLIKLRFSAPGAE